MGDNATPLDAMEYDAKIGKTIPYYAEFHKQTIDLVKNMEYKKIHWLDTGCGTGVLAVKAAHEMKNAHFLLADPSPEMIMQARRNTEGISADFIVAGSGELDFNNEFQVVTAVQSHHYMQRNEREKAVGNIYKALEAGGIFICFENIIPDTEYVKELELKRWGKYQLLNGKSEKEVAMHKARYGINYFPIRVNEHCNLLTELGFRYVNVLWLSYMQMGIYGIK